MTLWPDIDLKHSHTCTTHQLCRLRFISHNMLLTPSTCPLLFTHWPRRLMKRPILGFNSPLLTTSPHPEHLISELKLSFWAGELGPPTLATMLTPSTKTSLVSIVRTLPKPFHQSTTQISAVICTHIWQDLMLLLPTQPQEDHTSLCQDLQMRCSSALRWDYNLVAFWLAVRPTSRETSVFP